MLDHQDILLNLQRTAGRAALQVTTQPQCQLCQRLAACILPHVPEVCSSNSQSSLSTVAGAPQGMNAAAVQHQVLVFPRKSLQQAWAHMEAYMGKPLPQHQAWEGYVLPSSMEPCTHMPVTTTGLNWASPTRSIGWLVPQQNPGGKHNTTTISVALRHRPERKALLHAYMWTVQPRLTHVGGTW